jgi:hypothetical protein
MTREQRRTYIGLAWLVLSMAFVVGVIVSGEPRTATPGIVSLAR